METWGNEKVSDVFVTPAADLAVWDHLPRPLTDFMKSVNSYFSLSIEPGNEAHGHALGFECCIRGVA